MNQVETLFTINYLPSIQYFSNWVNAASPVLEKHCNYTKRTYRNRCDILGANGVLSLTVPVVKGGRSGVNTKDIRISYDTRWQDLHWRSIVSAYNSSPFFEYLMDDFRPFYEQHYEFLYDYNLQLMLVICDILDVSTDFKFTENFEKYDECERLDLRKLMHPKNDFNAVDEAFKPIPYRQVFQDRFSFIPNLSVIDLIFNKGPEALDWLEDSIVRL